MQVVQYIKSSSGAGDTGFPSSINIPNMLLFSDHYAFSALPGSYIHWVGIAIQATEIDGLLLNGLPVPKSDWDIMENPASMATRWLQVGDGFNRLEHLKGVKFGAYVYSVDRGSCSMAYMAGINAPSAYEMTGTSVPVDNEVQVVLSQL